MTENDYAIQAALMIEALGCALCRKPISKPAPAHYKQWHMCFNCFKRQNRGRRRAKARKLAEQLRQLMNEYHIEGFRDLVWANNKQKEPESCSPKP